MNDETTFEYDSDYAWMLSGLCRQMAPGEFFPSDGVGVDKARKICATCPVQMDCLEYALRNRIDHGVWGGASERERRRILKRRRDAQNATQSAEPAPATRSSLDANA